MGRGKEKFMSGALEVMGLGRLDA